MQDDYEYTIKWYHNERPEGEDAVVLRSHDFEKIWEKLESMGEDMHRVSVSRYWWDEDTGEDDIDIVGGGEAWEDGEGAFA